MNENEVYSAEYLIKMSWNDCMYLTSAKNDWDEHKVVEDIGWRTVEDMKKWMENL